MKGGMYGEIEPQPKGFPRAEARELQRAQAIFCRISRLKGIKEFFDWLNSYIIVFCNRVDFA